MRTLYRIIKVVPALALVLAMAYPSTASAKTFGGPYYNPNIGYKTEGGFSYIDCNNRCPAGDGTLLVDNRKNNWAIRVKFEAKVNGRFYTYVDQHLPDGWSGKFDTGYPPARSQVRVTLCFHDRATYQRRGKCEVMYGVNTFY